MSDVTLIQCAESKYNTKSKARNLYEKSAYYRAMRRWAQARNDPWYILSAKHGLLHPDTIIEPYDNRGLTTNQAIEISSELNSKGFTVVHITAGRDYTNPLVPELEYHGIDVVNHYAGCRIGERRRKLQQAARELENETLC